MTLQVSERWKLEKAERENDEYEYVLFRITDRKKFSKFMTDYLLPIDSNKKVAEENGYKVQILGSGKEPFEYENYLEYLDSSGVIDKHHPYNLSLEEWVQMGKPKEASLELEERIEKELT